MNDDYVFAKVYHMRRAGIPARVNEYGAAESEQSYAERKERDRQFALAYAAKVKPHIRIR